ncbi:hypothetical protein A2U01_0118601, partial [Trifolium medium]|nr:hypothetical protein [Trifolium medium]
MPRGREVEERKTHQEEEKWPLDKFSGMAEVISGAVVVGG